MASVFEPTIASLIVESFEGSIVENVYHGQGKSKFVGGNVYEVSA